MSGNFLLMANDCISFARNNLMARDYQEFCKRTLGPGTSYYDRMRVAERLIDEGVVLLENNRYHLGFLSEAPWLISALSTGDDHAWTILHAFPKRRIKFDPDNRVNQITGLGGELAVIAWLREQLEPDYVSRIVHVSLENDAAGYDIYSPSTRTLGSSTLLEVKTTTRPGPILRYFLSRNEAEIGARNENWHLVFVTVRGGVHELAGFATMADIRQQLPSDPPGNSRWMSVELHMNSGDLNPNLP